MAQQSAGAAVATTDAYTGEDRISALPDDLLVLVLLCLGTTAEAVRTSVLSHRWRPVWKRLPELHFDKAPGLHRIRELIGDPDPDPEAPAPAPDLRCLSVTTEGADPESAAAWLRAAARRVTGGLLFVNEVGDLSSDDEAEDEAAAQDRGVVQLPCFTKAVGIVLELGFLELALPSAGTFPRLTDLTFLRVLFQRPCQLGDVVSSPRCPSLQRLSVQFCRGIDGELTISSESLLEIELVHLAGSQQLTIAVATPALQRLAVGFCLKNYYEEAYVNGDNGGGDADADVAAVGAGAAEGNGIAPVVDITAPQLASLAWDDMYDQRYVHFGNVEQLKKLSSHFYVYLLQGNDLNRNCLRLLQRFQVLDKLTLALVFKQDLTDDLQYVMGDITMLPKIMSLKLRVFNASHAFGACCFHLFRMCTSIQRLAFQFFEAPNCSEVQYFCPSGCLCEQPTEWKTEELTLMHLEVVIIDTNGTDHEVAFFKRLFHWAVDLKKLRLKYDSNTESKVNEVHQKLQRFARPEIFITLEEFPK